MTDAQSEKKSVRGAFMDLEPDLRDLVRAAKLAFQLVCDERGIDELLYFSIQQCRERAVALEKEYDRLWDEADVRNS
jgi:hypothetical protein